MKANEESKSTLIKNEISDSVISCSDDINAAFNQANGKP